jgi:pyruvate dehydrogenase E2 component (dihydrolipoamide acetyltransferase)
MGVFAMPSLGADMEDGTLVEWLVKPGDHVKRGDVVAVVETQKGAIEIECFEEGEVRELRAELGQKLPVGAPLAVVGTTLETAPAEANAPDKAESAKPETPEPTAAPTVAPEGPPPAPPTPPVSAALPSAPLTPVAQTPVALPGPSAASPAARVRAQELGLDLAAIKGTGPGGVVILADLERDGTMAKPVPAVPDEAKISTRSNSPMDEMRKAIAAAMTRSKQTIPHFYLSQTIDVQPAIDFLTANNADVSPDRRILLGAVFVRAAALAATEVPSSNGHVVDGNFRPSAKVNPGVAIALRGGGLVSPALMDAPSMTLAETMAALRDLVTRARAGRLRAGEMTAGTLTVSSLGETGAEAMAGVIFPPQVTLVGLGAPQLRPWVVDGAVEPRMVVTLTLSVDHRVSDGRQAARFAAAFEKHLSQPEAL